MKMPGANIARMRRLGPAEADENYDHPARFVARSHLNANFGAKKRI